jgi:hypothetical protein
MESAGTERERGNSFSIAMEEQHFERGSPRAWGAERGFQGFQRLENTHRTGSQTRGWVFPEAGKSRRDVSQEMKRRVSESENAEGQKSSSEESTDLALGRPRTGFEDGAGR